MIISKNTKIFLSIFSIILVVITILAIIYTNNHKGSDESQIIIENATKVPVSKIDDFSNSIDKTSGVLLEDTYSTNGLTYTYKKDEENGIPIQYPIIDGLKNDIIEQSINEQILEKIKKVLDSNNFKNNSDSSAYAEANVVGNFADIISIKVFVRFTESFSKNYGINFRLDNGEKLKIDELFTYNAPKKNIITESAYKTFAINYYTNEGLSNEFYGNIESDILRFLMDYNDGKVAEFSFNPMYIEMYREGKTVRIEMKEYPEYMAVYKKFKSTSNLYDSNEKIIFDIPVFTKRIENVIADLYEKSDKTCILDVYIVKSDREKDFSASEMKAIDNYKKDLISRLDYAKAEAPIYYSNYVTVSRRRENNENILVFSEKESYITAKESELNTIYNKILDFERDVSNEDYIGSKINLLKEEKKEDFTFEIKYSVETGYEIKNEEDEEPEDAPEPSPSIELSQEPQVPESSESPSPVTTVTPSVTPTPTSTPSQTPVNITTQVYF
ncbi:MAG: hypothetical protein HFJ25_01235 [Clostridia bacterium]|nr:hypothetical protein [Clostridia bacterium]